MRGLQTARLSGRAEIVYDSALQSSEMVGDIGNTLGDLTFYLDGAHSPESMEACAGWFSRAVKEVPDQSSVQSFSLKLQTLKEVCGNGNVRPGKTESEKTSKKVRFSGDRYTISVLERSSSSSISTGSFANIVLQILLFNCMDVRDPETLLPILVDTCALSGIGHEL